MHCKHFHDSVKLFHIHCAKKPLSTGKNGSLMVQWLSMKCTVCDLKVMGSNLSRVELGVHSPVEDGLEPKSIIGIVNL